MSQPFIGIKFDIFKNYTLFLNNTTYIDYRFNNLKIIVDIIFL